MVKDISELIGSADFELPNIQSSEEILIDKKIVIKSIRFADSGQYGEYCIIDTDKGVFRSTSEVLNKQLKEGEKFLTEHPSETLEGTIKKVIGGSSRPYYTF